VKFAVSDLIGIRRQIFVGKEGLAAGHVELKRRADRTREAVLRHGAIDRLAS
jgi:prolyl-tRNA synthetase